MSATISPRDYIRTPRIPRRVGGAAVAAVGASLPEGVVTSAEIEARLGLAPDWIQRRTGIRERHVARPGERVNTHATLAAERALSAAEIDPLDVDLVIAATTSPDELLPNMAPMVAHALGASRAGAFDIGAACNGFLSALAAGTAMIDSGRASCVVVIGADFMSRMVDETDRGTATVFADGAGAIVLVSTGEPSRVGPVVLGSEGDTAGIIRVSRERGVIQMLGHETFKIAVSRLTQATLGALDAAGVELDEIDLFVYHQANGRILTAVADRLELLSHRVVDCIGELGNTSAATLPLALEHSVDSGRLRRGDRVLLAAFGAGFAWGATVLEWGVRV
ncbi:MAG: 3-oxoacyl-ACP synthase III family protein [Solirubrobacteraceae bacterium]